MQQDALRKAPTAVSVLGFANIASIAVAAAAAPPPPDLRDDGAADALDLALLETLLEHAPLGIALLDPGLRFLRVNATFAGFNALPAEAHLGRRLGDVLPRFPRRLLPVLEQVARTGKPVVNLEMTGGGRARRGGAEAPTFLASYYPVYDSRSGSRPGELLGIGAIVVDISDRKRAEEAAARAAARRSAEQMRQFLREILASVTEGRLHLCDGEAELPARLPVAAGPFPLAEDSLRAPRAALAATAETRAFPADRWQDLVTAVGEATMNAVMHAGGGAATIHATDADASDAAARLQVWVTDSGGGIALDHLHKVTLGRGFSTGGSFGHGFYLMVNTCDRLYLLTGPTGTTVVLEQDRVEPEPAWLDRTPRVRAL